MKIFSLILLLSITLSVFSSSNYKSDQLFSGDSNLKFVEVKNLTEYDYSLIVDKYEPDLQEYLDQVDESERKLKISACLMLFRSLLEKPNSKVIDTIKKSKFDASATFDKIYAESINNCVSIIDDKTSDKIVNEKQILYIDKSSENEYLKFEAQRYQIVGPVPKLTPEEEKLMKEIEDASINSDFPQNEYVEETNFSLFKGRGYYISVGFIGGILGGLVFTSIKGLFTKS